LNSHARMPVEEYTLVSTDSHTLYHCVQINTDSTVAQMRWCPQAMCIM
jgi:hypothetical protein